MVRSHVGKYVTSAGRTQSYLSWCVARLANLLLEKIAFDTFDIIVDRK